MKLSLTTRVVLAVVLVVASFAGAVGRGAVVQRSLMEQIQRLNEGYVSLLRGFDDVRRDLVSLNRQVQASEVAALRESVTASMRMIPGSVRIDAELAQLAVIADNLLRSSLEDDERHFLTNFAVLVAELQQENGRIGAMAREILARAPGEPDRKRLELSRRISALDKRIADATGILEVRTEQSFAAFADEQQQMLLQIAVLVGGAAFISLLVVGFVARALRPIGDLTRAASRLREGEYIGANLRAGTDEIGRLVEEFAAMTESIAERDNRLRAQRDAIETTYAQLIDAQRARVDVERLAAIGAMSSRVTHELRNPLSTLRLNAEMLAEELQRSNADADAHEMLAAIRREVERLIELTDQYLGLARESREHEAIAIDQAVGEVLRQLGPELDRQKIELQFIAGPARAQIADGPLRQVVFNLVRNASEALQDRADARVICVETLRDDRGAVLRVSDNGSGIEDGGLEAIFEPFVTTRPNGTGLGLNVCRQIARAHGGTIRATGHGKLGGATIEMVLPDAAIGR